MSFTIFGPPDRQGSYILSIKLDKPVSIVFGKFRNGQPIDLEPGRYLYVGSALGGRKGGFPLASRLLRHASRSGGRDAHAIRTKLSKLFVSWGYRPPARQSVKKLHWHIDYLLDCAEAELKHAFIFPGSSRLEPQLAEQLDSMPETSVVADRLGAQDATSGTHLFRIDETAALLPRLKTAMEERQKKG
ncbi:MAG TPA: DUF123 domain-containing protein [Chlorobaculum parvum]|uniref:DUF123 domain-containing protein n=1 Tax=Chlorobaculum parvum TaxID=274539 RepID=A0A7C5DG88_9CHLB|nr:DUF123 domain-containing protein [Chlorobaculum parvum]